MRVLAWSLSLFLLCACSGPTAEEYNSMPHASPDVVPDSLAPAAVIKSYFEAVIARDMPAALETGTDNWASNEADWEQGFTHSFVHGGLSVRSWRISGMDITEDGLLETQVRAILLREGEEPDGESMRFTLKEFADGWKIVDLN